MQVKRVLFEKIIERIKPGKAVIVQGPRQSGKSTILDAIARQSNLRTLRLDCDDAAVRTRLEVQVLPNLQNLIGNAELVIIDEAQRVKDIGLTLKIIVDQIKEVRLLVSGSSAFELANQTNEPLTGRKWEFILLPFSTYELVEHHGRFEESRLLHQRLLYGMYPEVAINIGGARDILNQLASSYLYKDLFSFQDLRKPELLDKMLKALAMQAGAEVSYNKLAEVVGSDISTVQRYIDLLEKAFIVFRLPAFSRNLRTELKKTRKIFFYDNGIRNAILGDFRPLEIRNDTGALWENFMVSERTKRNRFHGFYGNQWFWRTANQQEIDYIEEYDNQLYTYEFKWGSSKKAALPSAFAQAYPDAVFKSVTPENYQEFLMP